MDRGSPPPSPFIAEFTGLQDGAAFLSFVKTEVVQGHRDAVNVYTKYPQKYVAGWSSAQGGINTAPELPKISRAVYVMFVQVTNSMHCGPF